MAVFRVDKTKNYTVMSNTHLKDRNLSLKAKGLLSQMLSLPDEWDYSVDGLVRINKEAEGAIKSILSELKAAGYLVVTKVNSSENGKFEYIYDIFEEPQGILPQVDNPPMDNPSVDRPQVDEPQVDNATQLNTNILNNKEVNTKEVSTKRIKRDALEEILLENEPTASSEDLRNSFLEFIKMRKLIKKPLTEKGLMLAINRAYSLACGDVPTMIKIVDQSVLNSWQGLFELKAPTTLKRTTGGGSKANDALSQLEALAAEEGIEL